MLPRIEEKPKEIKQQPWYRERLREKYLKKGKTITMMGNNDGLLNQSAATKERLYNTKDWVFIKDGLDDFRDGLPPAHDDLIIKVYNNKKTLSLLN